ncbi:hypothetical protein [Mycolicibacterium mengxianglii]|uniref:hypothetical protein n=1 Tax=Mycolicibacterium mengxianglii TaxID=2736649 RepID=UPI0018D00FDF|nr:hypothetical protein [Mycolicibacterium mengxianglii]
MKNISKNFKTVAVGTVFGGSLLFTAGLGVAGAEPAVTPAADGLVSVAVGDTTIMDSVPADVASNASAAICGTAADDVSALAAQVDAQGVNQTVCAGLPGGGELVLAQNVSSETTAPVESPEATEGVTDPAAQGAADGSAGAPADSQESPAPDTADTVQAPAAEGGENVG